MPPPVVLNARGLRLSYALGDRAVTVLDGVDLTLREGELVAVTGPPSSGKSSLLRVLAGQQATDAGTVRWTTADGAADPVRRPGVALLTAHVDLHDDATIRAQMAASAAGTSPDVTGATDDAVDALLDELGLGPLGDRLPRKVSRGELQRAALACRLIARPLVLLADEPTGALDPRWSLAVVAALHRRCDEGMAALVTTHEPQVLEGADRVLTLADGRLA